MALHFSHRPYQRHRMVKAAPSRPVPTRSPVVQPLPAVVRPTQQGMYNVMVWIRAATGQFYKNSSDAEHETTLNYLRMQVHNSLRVGWKTDDIKLYTNFPFVYMGVQAITHKHVTPHNAWMNKWTAVKQLLDDDRSRDVFFHDIDAMQVNWVDYPQEVTGMAFALSHKSYPKWNGGVCFAKGEIAYWLTKRFVEAISDCEKAGNVKKTDEQIWDELSQRKRLAGFFSTLPRSYNLAEGRFWPDEYKEVKGDIKILHIKPHNFNRHWHFYKGEPSKVMSMSAVLTPPVLKELYVKYSLWHPENDKVYPR